MLGRLKERQQLVESTGALWEKLREGFRYVLTQRVVLLLLAVVAAASAC